jgi:thiosulfate dehydrogenase [quinone] large subunit
VNEWYVYLAQNVFLPNAALFSYLVAFGEVAIGIALILGVLTRFSALMSVLLGLSLLMAGATSTLPQMLAIVWRWRPWVARRSATMAWTSSFAQSRSSCSIARA